MTAIAARGRGLGTTVLAPAVLAEVDRVRDLESLATVLAHAGFAAPAVLDADAVDRFARDRIAADLAILARWTDRLDALALDEDRRSLRAIVRGLAGGIPARRRLAGTVATARLPRPVLVALSEAVTIDDVAALLVERGHPLAAAMDHAPTPIDVLAIELRLAKRFAELARSRDRALATFVAQVIDTENAIAALLFAARGSGLDAAAGFVPGGRRIERTTFVAAARAAIETARTTIAHAFAGTPIEKAVFATSPAAIEDAALTWQLATQTQLRRSDPLGCAPAIHAVLRRRDEARHLRRAAWRVVLGGTS